MDLDYSKFTNTNVANYSTYYYLANGAKQKADLTTRNLSPSTISINTEKADYTLPFSKTAKFEAGIKASNVKTDNDLQAQQLKSSEWANDAGRTNHFIYTEKINAAYVNISKSFKKTSVQVGLRAENTHSIGDLLTQSPVDTSYLNFFPSVFLNQTLSAKNEIGFSYSRRIDRPDYENLNPFVYYLDPLTFSKGNPFLKPQYTQSFEFNYTYAKAINVSLSYSYTTNAITEVLLPGTDKKTFQTTLNLKTQNTYNININSPYQFTKWWSGNANLNGFYMEFKDDKLPAGVSLPAGQAAAQFRTSNTFILGKTYKGEIATDYQSPLTYGLLKIQSQYSIDLGISHSFANKKATIKLSTTDVFNTRQQKLSSVFDNQTLDIRQKNETRVTRLTLTWNFGNSKIRARQHKTGLEDEKNRVKTGN